MLQNPQVCCIILSLNTALVPFSMFTYSLKTLVVGDIN